MSDNTKIDIMEAIKTKLYELLNSLEEDEKTTVKDLVDKIVYATGVKISQANGIVPMLIHNWAQAGNGRIERGRTGGVYRGTKKERVDPRPRCSECHQVLRKINSSEDSK
jgi:hypothetical protein